MICPSCHHFPSEGIQSFGVKCYCCCHEVADALTETLMRSKNSPLHYAGAISAADRLSVCAKELLKHARVKEGKIYTLVELESAVAEYEEAISLAKNP